MVRVTRAPEATSLIPVETRTKVKVSISLLGAALLPRRTREHEPREEAADHHGDAEQGVEEDEVVVEDREPEQGWSVGVGWGWGC